MSIRRLLTSRGPSLERQQTIAIHEAGHAVAARMLGATDIAVNVGRRAGGFSFTFDGSAYDEAVILLAGHEAEVALTGADSGGASYDLKQARKVLRYQLVPLASAGTTAAELVRGARLDIEAEAARLLDGALIGRRAA
ncbi:hypothetical protein ACG83_11040 [Frankia sp. R43]|uniref:hypothetical protein n=1 Tax=Frankia sp. R43 TaxID=269536 RepID=UPI0006CA3BC2|nr:hypothetical protein [Frankia sp. R43]KPM55799.1 hypothetical protein ACG83_11040 [Frankia sp. R43]